MPPGPERHRIVCNKAVSVSVPAPSSLCVFCGSRFGADSAARDVAVRTGELLARERITLVYGGGGVGLMGLLANAALQAGRRGVGIIPQFPLPPQAGPPPPPRTRPLRPTPPPQP